MSKVWWELWHNETANLVCDFLTRRDALAAAKAHIAANPEFAKEYSVLRATDQGVRLVAKGADLVALVEAA